MRVIADGAGMLCPESEWQMQRLHYCITWGPVSASSQGRLVCSVKGATSDSCFNCHNLSRRTSWTPRWKDPRAIDINVLCSLFMKAKGKLSPGFLQNTSDSEILLNATCPNLCLHILQRSLLFWVELPELQLMWKIDFMRHSPGKNV